MDNIIPVLWLLFMLAVTVIPAISKARQAKKAANAKKNTVPQEEMAQSKPQYRTQPLDSSIASTLQTTNFNTENSFEEMENTYAEPGTTDANTPAEQETIDFDLRKAVIYSEILKPKFDE